MLISDEGHALIADLGYTSLVNASFNMTVVSPKGGTINWMSPEIIESFGTERGCLTSIEGDIWAYGMTCLVWFAAHILINLPNGLQELFTRQVPFHNLKGWMSVLNQILTRPPERPSDSATNSRMSDEWWNISFSCWARDPLLRPSLSQLLCKVEETKVSVLIHLYNILTQLLMYICYKVHTIYLTQICILTKNSV